MNQDFNNEREPLPTFGNEPDFGADESRSPLPEYSDNNAYYDDPEIEDKVNYNFKKALASVILAEFPIMSIVAFFLSHSAWKCAWELTGLAKERGVRLPGKNIAVKILSGIGRGISIFGTIFWTIYLLLIVLAIVENL